MARDDKPKAKRSPRRARTKLERRETAGLPSVTKNGDVRSPANEGLADAREAYFSNPDWGVARVAKELFLPLSRVQAWSARDGWVDERKRLQDEVRDAIRNRIVAVATEEVGGSFLETLRISRRVRELLGQRIVSELEAERSGSMRTETVEASTVELTGEAEPGKSRPKKVHVKTIKHRIAASERLLISYLDSEDRWTRILLGLVEPSSRGSMGVSAGGEEPDKVVRKLQAAAAAIEALDAPTLDLTHRGDDEGEQE